jgi:hypothetical protein
MKGYSLKLRENQKSMNLELESDKQFLNSLNLELGLRYSMTGVPPNIQQKQVSMS